jgi:hypothetical protein
MCLGIILVLHHMIASTFDRYQLFSPGMFRLVWEVTEANLNALPAKAPPPPLLQHAPLYSRQL